jgi:hypothetical protein
MTDDGMAAGLRRLLAIALVALAGTGVMAGMLALVGGRRLADIDLFGEVALVVAAHVALVAGVGLDEFTFGHRDKPPC